MGAITGWRVVSGVMVVAVLAGVTRISLRSFAAKMTDSLVALDFEVFGRVQGVFFRKCTEEEAEKLGVRGWCKNMPQGTVQGQIEGPKSQVDLLKHWLEFTGSPMSKIDKAKFENERQINEYTFNDFSVKRRPR